MSKSFLDSVYSAKTADETRDIYDAWSESYEKEVADNAYATPGRCAAALAEHGAAKDVPVLDFGCGTGLSGQALHAAGFTAIDGCDLSPGMLEKAQAKGVYRRLTPIEADAPVPTGYAMIAAIGVIGAGAAPLDVFHNIVDALEPGGFFVFSFNDHTLQDPTFEAAVAGYISDGTMVERFREHGAHLPGRDMQSTVYVLEKT